MNALIIDDAADTRLYVRALLDAWGYNTVDGADGLDGLERMGEATIELVICDWMMPRMSGLEFCKAVRAAAFKHYVYIILLTARSDKSDLLEGLSAGADDFLSKPVDAKLLRARLRVAERILTVQGQLADQNRTLRESRERLQQAYNQIQRDLTSAARIQRQMLPPADRLVSPFSTESLFLPAAQVSGDSFNFFPLNQDLIGFYLFDVSGHGVQAALFSARLNAALMPTAASHRSLADLGTPAAGFPGPGPFLSDVNSRWIDPDADFENYATIVYGTLDKHCGEAQIVLAGHPPPLILRNCGVIETLEPGGLPFGMFPDVDYQPQRVLLNAGDRLILYSDGVTECSNRQGELFGIARMQSALAASTGDHRLGLTRELEAQLQQWSGTLDFDDDISVLVLERDSES
ncbi:SpoIIE family protein phosphatase [uncultured Thiodictyon sp.]|uniref:PP2C family protein-serine/threonine phosphatase n=1 Tax=uncultured Thiodictyon sp. TaxID=1846217 RepID=UPI0025E5D8DA|nr:SpoIIE family protein phosphatase [uncultured Thiodictyon sp.]